MHVAIGSDHGGFELKHALEKMLDEKGVTYDDFGANSASAVDYPDVAAAVGREISLHKADAGILICRTGIGIEGVRAALCGTPELARLSRQHNNANVLTLAGDMPSADAAVIANVFLDTPFSGDERHKRRVEKIHSLTGK
jgi:RpiB/LacA/LacB family sugar-phosphate isomerase